LTLLATDCYSKSTETLSRFYICDYITEIKWKSNE